MTLFPIEPNNPSRRQQERKKQKEYTVKKITLILVGLVTIGGMAPLHSAEDKAALETEQQKTDEASAYFDHKAAFTLEGDFERGRRLATQSERFPRSCRFCHGADGIAPGDHHPNLAGQKDRYLRSQLVSFIFLQRQSHIMNQTLVNFEKEKPLYSEQEIADLAFYFSRLSPAGDGSGEQPMVSNR